MKLTLVIAALMLQSALGFEFATVGTKRVLLFAIRAGSGRQALEEFRRSTSPFSLPLEEAIPDLFRSALLNNFRKAIDAASATYIVLEMRTNNQAVASATFRLDNSTGTESWFSAANLVDSSPVSVANPRLFLDASNTGDGGAARSFFIFGDETNCDRANGLMGVIDSGSDSCAWAQQDGAFPVFVYQQGPGTFANNAGYADQLLVYMENSKLFQKRRK